MTQLTKIEIVRKTEKFLAEIKVLCDNVKKTKKWLDMAILEDKTTMQKRFDAEIKLAEDKFAESNKFKEENPFDDAPMRAVK